jgi:hypothetical protein
MRLSPSLADDRVPVLPGEQNIGRDSGISETVYILFADENEFIWRRFEEHEQRRPVEKIHSSAKGTHARAIN